MLDWFTWDFWQQNALSLMFFSAFLSATVLPGNSEVVFVSLISSQLLSPTPQSAVIFWLIFWATLGNSLGSATTYVIGRWFPQINEKNLAKSHRTLWVIKQTERYGVWALLLSWLPIVGDIFCAVAGWLRLNWWKSLIFITLGKLCRYLVLLFLNQFFLL